jgi:phosphoserine phosphatase RsbU/P
MSRSKRVLAWLGLFLQGYALYAAVTRSLIWPFMWPREGLLLYCWLLFVAGGLLLNGMLSSEFLRKTQLESDLTGARRIQQTLQPQSSIAVPGYEIQTTYRPFRDVGGDYFDVVELPDNRTLFAMADVAGKGMPAALLAANVQALVRTIPTVDSHPLTLARQINQHLSRYTPDDRFVTAVFIVLSHESGALTYVNAGHNAPILSGTTPTGSTMSLDATGIPLGLFREAEYEARTTVLPPGGALLLFTDGLPDSIRGEKPEALIRAAMAGGSTTSIAGLTALVDRQLNEDDITIVLVKRPPGFVAGLTA